MSRDKAILALSDGTIFHGDSIGAEGESVGEIVFNTAMTGYQEILTDPSYKSQVVTLTYPHIGNTGTNAEDFESKDVFCSGLVIRDYPYKSSSWRNEAGLEEFLVEHKTLGIAGIDTRRLTRIIREKGSQSSAIIAGSDIDESSAINLANTFNGLSGLDLAREVTCKKQYSWTEGSWLQSRVDRKFKVVALDFGVKKNILRLLVDLGCELEVVPAGTKPKEIMAMNPDGIFLSNGPGDPEPCEYAIETIKELADIELPIFGICLGHQLLSLAFGAKTEKMKFGHHGANHPVQDLITQKVSITSQNHGFTVSEHNLPEFLNVTHRSLFDGTIQGIQHNQLPAFSFQGHPEASPGPHDLIYLFKKFISLMESRKK